MNNITDYLVNCICHTRELSENNVDYSIENINGQPTIIIKPSRDKKTQEIIDRIHKKYYDLNIPNFLPENY